MEFPELIAKAVQEQGTEKTASQMARFLSMLAYQQGVSVTFDCDLASIEIHPKLPKQHH